MAPFAALPANLQCEGLVDPIGLIEVAPRLSWQMEDERRGAKQTAFRIRVAKSADDLARGERVFVTPKILSNQTTDWEYAPDKFEPRAPAIASRKRIYWQVQLWDAEGLESPWSSVAFWESGLLKRTDWDAKWIGAPWFGGPRTGSPAPYLRREFELSSKPAKARLYVTSLGLFEARLNGRKVGDDVLVPGWTEFSKRVHTLAYDVTSLVHEGSNAIGAILGDGWYCGHVGGNDRQGYGDRPKFYARLEIEGADGGVRAIVSDETWSVATGPILENDLLMGETYDARRELGDWDLPGQSSDGWQPVEVFGDPGIELEPHRSSPVRVRETLTPIAPPREIGWRAWLFDLGQNMVGWARIRAKGTRGTTIRIRYSEILDEKQRPYYANLRAARATDYYTFKGDGIEEWEPKFTFHGFRYVEIAATSWVVNSAGEGFELAPDGVVGVVAHTAMTQTGEFECSDPLVNQLEHNIVWGQKGNFLEVPTDCPQRDERLGWTGDAQVFARTATFHFDVRRFFEKWQQDLAEAQFESGAIPCVAPNPRVSGTDGGAAWSDAMVICPWTMYLAYGDRRLLEENYDAMRRYVDYLHKEAENSIRGHERSPFRGFGDWLNIDAPTSHELIGTAFLAYTTRIFSQIAEVLGKNEDASAYAAKFEEARQAFLHSFVTPAGRISNETQTAYLLALHFDLLPEEMRAGAVEALARDVEARGVHISAGFVGSSYLNPVLTRFGRNDLAYKLLFQKTWPSWLYPVTEGATTIWERWDGWTRDKGFQDAGMNSFNHYAYGAVGAWLYASVAGLSWDPEQPAYRHILVQPHPGEGLTYARASLRTRFGLAESRWRVEGSKFVLDVVVPPNSTAKVFVPSKSPTEVVEKGGAKSSGVRGDSAVFEIESGRYHFEGPYDEASAK